MGLDLVGQEDKGRNLIDFAKKILTLPRGTKFFFHAGETNWNGVIDDNLVRLKEVRNHFPFNIQLSFLTSD